MRIGFILFIFLVLWLNLTSASALDTTYRLKHQITIGTTGFYLPKFKDYSISAFNIDEFSTYRFFINNASYQIKFNELYDLKFSYNGMKSNVYRINIDPSDLRDGSYSKFVRLHIISAGVARSFNTDFKRRFTLETQPGVSIQYRFGYERNLWHLEQRKPLKGPGIKLNISENLVFNKRYVLGINADFHAFYQPDKEYALKDHNYFISNALYLGIKF